MSAPIEVTATINMQGLRGSDYTVHLTIDGDATNDMNNGDGWFYN